MPKSHATVTATDDGITINLSGSNLADRYAFIQEIAHYLLNSHYKLSGDILWIDAEHLATGLGIAMRHFYIYYNDFQPNREQWKSTAGDRTMPIFKTVASVYSILFIQADAPMEVVTAAYRALAKLYHPDTGGTLEKMQTLNDAYAKIQRERK